MNRNDVITLSVAKFVTGDDIHICRLCFVSTKNGTEYCLNDYLQLRKDYINEAVSFGQIFEALGVKMEFNLPSSICSDCAALTINSYLFRRFCEYSDAKWSECLDRLDNDISDVNTVDSTIKSAFVILGNENLILTCRKGKVTTKSAAVDKIKQMMLNKMRYQKRKEDCLNAICEECGEQCYSVIALQKHMRIHKSKFPCPQCAKLYATKMKLRDHIERIHSPKTIPCNKCKYKFSSLKMLKEHEKASHMAVICKLCFIQFPSRHALRNHLNKHDVIQCSKCPKSFLNKQSFQSHSKLCGKKETRIINFYCDLCGKGYYRKHSLRSHIKTDHGFGVLYTCNWCNKQYDAHSKLRNHIVKHTRERNFICQYCGGKFVTKAALVYHTRLHTGEKPYSCPHCPETFLSASRRMQHIRRKHYEPTKECPICHTKFVSNSQLKIHQMRHYNPQSKCYVPHLELSVDAGPKEVKIVEGPGLDLPVL